MKHVGWWSEHNGFTPSRTRDTKRAAAFMRTEMEDVPVYVAASDFLVQRAAGKRRYNAWFDGLEAGV